MVEIMRKVDNVIDFLKLLECAKKKSKFILRKYRIPFSY